jgi:purine-nucleoside phosphorylase
VAPDPELTTALREAGGGPAVGCVSTDLFYGRRPDVPAGWREQGASVVEMEAAALFRLAELHGLAAACVLGVSDVLGASDDRTRIDQDELLEMGVQLGRVGAAALAGVRSTTR